MSRAYFAYANSLDGQTGFSLTRADHQYFGRFTDEDDRDDLVSAVQASLYPGDSRNLALNSDEEKATSSGWTVSYDLSDAIEPGKSYVVSADILLDTASTPTPRVTFYYDAPKNYSDTPHKVVASWDRYVDKTLPVLAVGQDKIAFDGRHDASHECSFKVKNVKVELGSVATSWMLAPEDALMALDAKIGDPASYEWMAIRDSTDADWWSTLGVVRSKAVITLADGTVIDVFGTDYIKSWQVTQGLSSKHDKPGFNFVSDKLEMVLYNLDNDFNPFAEDSQYYEKFVLGIKLELYTLLDYLGHGDELNWVPLGKYKVAGIDVSPTGTECHILAYDYGYDSIETSKQPSLVPLSEITTLADVEDFLELMFPGYNVAIDSDIDNLPKKLFPLESKLKTIDELLEALNCFSRCNGYDLSIGTFNTTKRSALDESNIGSLSPEQSLVQQYNNSAVGWNELGLDREREVASLTVTFDSLDEKIYTNVVTNGYIDKLERISGVTVDGSALEDIEVSGAYANVLTLAVQTDRAGEAKITVYAETIAFNEITEGVLDNSKSVYSMQNKFIQSQEHAIEIKRKLDGFVTTKNQYCDASIRFNPLLQLSWLLGCKHSDYNVDMDAYIVEQSFGVSDSSPAGWHTVKLMNAGARKSAQDMPDAPTMASKTGTSVTLNAIAGCEYKRDGRAWQDSPVFTDLSPVTAYTFYARKKETDDLHPSPPSPGTTITTDKDVQAAPSAPTMASRTGTSITLNTIAGCEYKKGDGAWQDSTTFTGLSPVTSYTFYARKKETPTLYPSLSSAGASITTDKNNQVAPSAPTMASKTGNSITLNTITGCEYMKGDNLWQDSPTFTGLSPVTPYTFYARKKETPTLYPSPSSVGTVITTDKENQVAPSAPTLASRTSSSITLNMISGCEYQRDATGWQDSPTFTGLSPAVTSAFYARKKETGTHYASPSSAAASFTTDKVAQSAPSAPTMASRTGVSITLTAISGCEYKVGSGDWQDSATFTGLSPVTSYTFYARLKETPTHYASPSSAGSAISTTKDTQTAPSAPTLASKTDVSVVLNTITGCEYQRGTSGWQDSPTFSGLTAFTPYSFYARKKETTTLYASPSSSALSVTTWGVQTAPSAPAMKSRTDTSIELNAITGCEYKRGNGSWQDSTTFTGLSPVTSYTFYARKKATDTHYASPSSTGADIATDKSQQTAPSAPTMASRTGTSITLDAIIGCEYQRGTSGWQDSTTFTGLSPVTTYTFYARKKETTTHYASEPSDGAQFTTDKGVQTAPSAPTMASRTGESITLNAITGCEYKRGSGDWQDSLTFSGLSPVTTYVFYARKKETASYYASPESSGASITTDKGTQTAPPAPTQAGYTNTSITLTSVSGCEYKRDDGSWQDSPIFTGLGIASFYTFYQRKKETTTHYASPSSPGALLSTEKGAQTAPSAPTLLSRTDTSITLTVISGCEYRIGSNDWQDSNTFTGLSPATSYSFTARKKETETLFASPSSEATSLTTDKGSQTAPSAPTLSSKTGHSITLVAVSGCEYKRGTDAWQDSTTFSGLSPVTSYTFYQRKKATSTHYASPDSVGTQFTTDKGTQTAPSAPTMASRTGTSITLTSVSGCEYKRDSGSWQDSTTFTGLSPVTSYTFYARKKETLTLNPSPSSAGSSITTDKGNQSAPAAPTVSDIEHDSAKVTSVTGAEVRLGTGSWFDSPKTFTGLTEETQYTAYARMKETVTLYASPISAGKVFETPSAMPEEGSWEWVQWHVRNGTHLTEFEVGEVFSCLYNGSSINLMIIGMDLETPTNTAYTHSMTLHTVDCLPDYFQFDSPESSNPDSNRKNYGNNRWLYSNIRQWLNSTASSYVWTATHTYDKAPSDGFLSGYSGGGFLNLLDPELVAVLGSVEKKTALANVDGANGQDTTSEMAFLISQYESGLGTASGGNTTGEFTYPWYNSNTRRVKKVGASNSYWWLRSPDVSGSDYVRYVRTSGAVRNYDASDTRGLAPACVII